MGVVCIHKAQTMKEHSLNLGRHSSCANYNSYVVWPAAFIFVCPRACVLHLK